MNATEAKKVKRKIFADGTYAYIDNNYLGTEMLMYNSVGRATPVLWLLPETILATDWEEVLRMKKNEKCCGNCHWFDNEDVYGVGWCSNNEHESSCDQVCDEYEF